MERFDFRNVSHKRRDERELHRSRRTTVRETKREEKIEACNITRVNLQYLEKKVAHYGIITPGW